MLKHNWLIVLLFASFQSVTAQYFDYSLVMDYAGSLTSYQGQSVVDFEARNNHQLVFKIDDPRVVVLEQSEPSVTFTLRVVPSINGTRMWNQPQPFKLNGVQASTTARVVRDDQGEKQFIFYNARRNEPHTDKLLLSIETPTGAYAIPFDLRWSRVSNVGQPQPATASNDRSSVPAAYGQPVDPAVEEDPIIQLATYGLQAARPELERFAPLFEYVPEDAVWLYYKERPTDAVLRLGPFASVQRRDLALQAIRKLPQYKDAFPLSEDYGAVAASMFNTRYRENPVLTPKGYDATGAPAGDGAATAAGTILPSGKPYAVQIMASKKEPLAQNLQGLAAFDAYYVRDKDLYKIRLGFFSSPTEAEHLLKTLIQPGGFPNAFVVEEPAGAPVTLIHRSRDLVRSLAQYDEMSRGYVHTVQKGETLYSIAQQYQLTVDWLRLLNNLDEKTVINIGQRLRLR